MSVESILKSGRAEKWLRVLLVIMGAIALFGFVRSVSAEGSMRISGIGRFPVEGECVDDVTGYDFANKMTGDLEGCLYVFVESYEGRPGGTYIETGTEIYVGGGQIKVFVHQNGLSLGPNTKDRQAQQSQQNSHCLVHHFSLSVYYTCLPSAD